MGSVQVADVRNRVAHFCSSVVEVIDLKSASIISAIDLAMLVIGIPSAVGAPSRHFHRDLRTTFVFSYTSFFILILTRVWRRASAGVKHESENSERTGERAVCAETRYAGNRVASFAAPAVHGTAAAFAIRREL